jgi:hypothetical protein
MSNAEGFRHPDDVVVITIDIEDCPMAEIPLDEFLDADSTTLRNSYHDVIREYVSQQLEDTTWLSDTAATVLIDAGFGMYHARDQGVILSLRKPALQRLINHRLSARENPEQSIVVRVLIRFLMAEIDLPKPPRTSTSNGSSRSNQGSVRSRHTNNPPSVINANDSVATEGEEEPRTEETVQVPAVVPPPVATANRQELPNRTDSTMFRGYVVDTRPIADTRPTTNRVRPGQYYTPQEPPNRPLVFDSGTTNRTTALVRTPTRNHPFSAEVTFGSETFEEYMTQFMNEEVKFKDFRKASIPRFDSSKQESFVHWYKLFCSTCLQWGIWCPPYESAQEDNIHGAWWPRLPASVRAADRFMSGLIYSALTMDSTFPIGSKELNAVEGCPPNAGYHALYALFRLHHPLLHSVYSTANQIPRQRRAESFSLYTRRLQDFMARERLATRTYTESEALDLAIRNLHPDWSQEFRRMVERDKRTGPGGQLPFKLTMPQLATTLVEYAAEIGRDAPTGGGAPSNRSGYQHSTVRRIEVPTTSDDNLCDDEVDLIVRAMSQNQAVSPLCLGCQQPGHTLDQCHRFVDYIVAESLAQRHPQLKAQVASAHRQFRSRLASMTTGGRGGRQGNQQGGVVRSLQQQPDASTTVTSELSAYTPSATNGDPTDSTNLPVANEDDVNPFGYQQHAVSVVSDDPDADFEACFTNMSIHSVSVAPIVAIAAQVSTPPSLLLSEPDILLQNRLAATQDSDTGSIYAHADNGSMACTTNNRDLLFAYRPLPKQASVRLYDAGQHAHQPIGVGFLRVPVDNNGTNRVSSVFVRTYYTPTIPGVIVSHSAISRQLGTTGYHMSSFREVPGEIHFPHRLRRSQDIRITLQPTDRRGGLTFTDALILPTEIERTMALPSVTTIQRICTDHAPHSLADILNPVDGMHCQACYHPPDFC